MTWLRSTFIVLQLLQMLRPAFGKLNMTGCEHTKGCWVSGTCLLDAPTITDTEKEKSFIFFKKWVKDTSATDSERNRMRKENVEKQCKRYFIAQPGYDFMIFEMSESKKSSDQLKLQFGENSQYRSGTIVCENHVAKTESSSFKIEQLEFEPVDHSFCRFKVTKPSNKDFAKTFHDLFNDEFAPKDVYISSSEKHKVEVRDYNWEHLKTRVPCNFFVSEGIMEDEHRAEPTFLASGGVYECKDNYEMSYRVEANHPFTKIGTKCEQIRCVAGVGQWKKLDRAECGGGDNKELQDKKTGKNEMAKCSRPRNSLCVNPFENAKDFMFKHDKNTNIPELSCPTKFMIINDNKVIKNTIYCSSQSFPGNSSWELKNKDNNEKPFHIKGIYCTDELNCHYIDPIRKFECVGDDNCVIFVTKTGNSCTDNGGKLVVHENKSGKKHPISKISCNAETGKWDHDVKLDSKIASTLVCIGIQPRTTTVATVAAASTGNVWKYAGFSLLALLLLLLIILLLWCCVFRKRREEPKVETSTPQPTSTTNAEPSLPEISVTTPPPPPPPPAPAPAPTSPEPDVSPYGGRRVQMINVTKEHLREMEPLDPTLEEHSARDKSNSNRSLQTTGGDPTVTGARSDQTNDVSRTIAPTESEVSRKRGNTSTGYDKSETGVGGGITIGEVEEQQKKRRPKVEFRERVSVESDGKSSEGSKIMPPQTTQVEKTMTVESKRKKRTTTAEAEAFGKVNPVRDEASNPNRSKLITDNSKTG